MQRNKIKALSYVELIMVMTIIGVVSAISIPTLKKYSQRTEFGQLAKKAYLNIENAVDNTIMIRGPIRNWNFGTASTFCQAYLADSMNLLQNNCTNAVPQFVGTDAITYKVTCCNGSECVISVDVNGSSQKPNIVGKDQFEFEILKSQERVQPKSGTAADLLRQNNWQFTDELWSKVW